MILENYRDRKLKELYQVITRSDFKGNLEDDYMLSVMYAMRCIDRIQENDPFIKENDYVNVAKEIRLVKKMKASQKMWEMKTTRRGRSLGHLSGTQKPRISKKVQLKA